MTQVNCEEEIKERKVIKLSREVRIGELIAALSLLSGIAMAYIEGRIRPIEEHMHEVKVLTRDLETRSEQRIDAMRRDLKADLNRMEDKLDRVLTSGKVESK